MVARWLAYFVDRVAYRETQTAVDLGERYVILLQFINLIQDVDYILEVEVAFVPKCAWVGDCDRGRRQIAFH